MMKPLPRRTDFGRKFVYCGRGYDFDKHPKYRHPVCFEPEDHLGEHSDRRSGDYPFGFSPADAVPRINGFPLLTRRIRRLRVRIYGSVHPGSRDQHWHTDEEKL